MNTNYEEFYRLFELEDKEKAVAFVLGKLENQELDVVELYSDLLTPALNNIKCDLDKRICIWKEHVKTGIVRTIVECCYPYVIEKRNALSNPLDLTAVILCPPEEYHDLGARMVSDYFTICGCDAIFAGANTPYQDFYNAIDIIRPDLIAISVSDYYNMIAAKRMISEIKLALHNPVRVIVGGNAFTSNPDKYKVIGADYYARTFENIQTIVNSEVTP